MFQVFWEAQTACSLRCDGMQYHSPPLVRFGGSLASQSEWAHAMQVMELFFQGARKSGPRDTMLRLDIMAEGTLNAVVFWFDLHLDDERTITSGASSPLSAAKT